MRELGSLVRGAHSIFVVRCVAFHHLNNYFTLAALIHCENETKMADRDANKRPTNGIRVKISVTVATCFMLVIGIVLRNEANLVKETLSAYSKEEPHDTLSEFSVAYQLSYNDVIVDAKKSCLNQSDIDHCFTRKRVDISTFGLKENGGLQDSDRQLIADLYYEAESIFEYGIGESTAIAAKTNVPRYTGVDSSAEWISKARSKAPDRFRFYFADVGPTRGWGYPRNAALKKNPFDYQISPLFVEREPFDVYLVDGRWRVACVMASFLHAIHTGGNMSKIRVVLHDYFNRGGSDGRYRIVESIALVEKESERATVLALRHNVQASDLLDIWKVCMKGCCIVCFKCLIHRFSWMTIRSTSLHIQRFRHDKR